MHLFPILHLTRMSWCWRLFQLLLAFYYDLFIFNPQPFSIGVLLLHNLVDNRHLLPCPQAKSPPYNSEFLFWQSLFLCFSTVLWEIQLYFQSTVAHCLIWRPIGIKLQGVRDTHFLSLWEGIFLLLSPWSKICIGRGRKEVGWTWSQAFLCSNFSLTSY